MKFSLLELHAVVVFLCMYIKTTCAAYNPDHTFDDLKQGCTGDISEGDTILRSWALKTPPEGLHARCAKRKHHAVVRNNALFFRLPSSLRHDL